MAKLLGQRTIRVATNVYEFDRGLTDSNSSASPATWRANPLRIEMGVFELPNGEPLDLTNITKIVVSAKRTKTADAPFIFTSIASIAETLITREEWTQGLKHNAAVEIPGALLDLAPDVGQEFVELYMTITATTTATQEVTLEVGSLVIHEDFNATDPSILGEWRVDATYGPVFFDGIGWSTAAGGAVDGHTAPASDPGYSRPGSPVVGELAWNTNLIMAEWFDGVGWINEIGAPTDGHTLPASDGSYVRPAYPGEQSMTFDLTLILPIWYLSGQWVNAANGAI